MEYADKMKEAIKEIIEKAYGEINDLGCCSYSGRWMSTECIFKLVCKAIDENDYMFSK